MTQLEEKKMLAKFMGWKETQCGRWIMPNLGIPLMQKTMETHFYSYSGLMKCVEKIESLEHLDFGKFYVWIEGNDCNIHSSLYDYEEPQRRETKLDAIYRACVEFVKWWNENKNL